MITLSGYIDFIRNVVGVSADDLPDSSPYFPMTYNSSVEWVNPQLLAVMPASYELAVYNLGASFLINWGPESVFGDLRKSLGLNNINVGVINSASDQGTSSSRIVSDFFSTLSLSDLQMLRDPYGRAYLMLAQQAGSLWGLS